MEDFQAVKDALEMMEIADMADRPVDELSGGQRQRVWIALALAQQTDILFLDEPTTFLGISLSGRNFGSVDRSEPQARNDDCYGTP